jgi:hypothetical protein
MDCGRSPGLTFSIRFRSAVGAPQPKPNPERYPENRMRNTGSTERQSPPAAAPDHAGNVGASRRSEKGKEERTGEWK